MNTGRASAGLAPEAYCEERHRLLNEFTEAVQELGVLQDAQVAALINGDEDSTRFDVFIHSASERKQRAKDAYMSHIELHSCAAQKYLPTL